MKALAADDPRVIGEYRLRAQLGAGGMGRVYLGLSPAGRAVAIKVVHPDLASDAEFLRRFAQEVAAARAVSGIYTAPVVASGLNERPPWLATAFVPGPSLEQVVAEHGPLPEQALWPLLGGLVEALQAIHACGVVHRDLKPANVLLATDGPRVIDFGISRAADGTSLTAAGVVFGTPGYMSPEQAEGRGAGPESDVFALGCVVAYGAAGMGPFGTGTAAAVLYRVVHAEPVLDRVPPKLREVLAACLAKDPAARPTLRALSGMLAPQLDATGPSAVAFWPSSVAGLIGEYQARLEQETRSVTGRPRGSPGPAPAPATTPSDPGRPAARRPAGWPAADGGASPSPAAAAIAAAVARPTPCRTRPQAAVAVRRRRARAGAIAGISGVRRGTPVPRERRAGVGAAVPAAPGYTAATRAGSAGIRRQRAGRLPAAVPGGGTGCGPAAARHHGHRGPADVRGGGLRAGLGDRRHRGLGQHRQGPPGLPPGGDHRLAGAATWPSCWPSAEIALWLGIARACRRGRSGARVAGTVLFGAPYAGRARRGRQPQAGLGPAKVLTLIGWLIGAARWCSCGSARPAPSSPLGRHEPLAARGAWIAYARRMNPVRTG